MTDFLMVLIVDSAKPKHWFRLGRLSRPKEKCPRCEWFAHIVIWNLSDGGAWKALVQCQCGFEDYIQAPPNDITFC